MLEVPSADVKPGTIVQEMQAGYMLKDRLLRPAMVGGGEEAGLSEQRLDLLGRIQIREYETHIVERRSMLLIGQRRDLSGTSDHAHRQPGNR